ncbi:hypothetical protein O6H91_Y477400 [Diphasiastrum complanatum]|nr:hypothetical protein O6H91_Y477400 [Diphasiastrum complanatum]
MTGFEYKVQDPMPRIAKRSVFEAEGSADRVDMNVFACSRSSEIDPISLHLSAKVHDFLEEDQNELDKMAQPCCSCAGAICDGRKCFSVSRSERNSSSDRDLLMSDMLKESSKCISTMEITATESLMEMLQEKIRLDIQEDDLTLSINAVKHSVMIYLLDMGYNAGICRSMWDPVGVVPGGCYDFIDLIVDASNCEADRLFVDVDLRAQFEIARPTAHYRFLLRLLPRVFVGTADRLRKIVDIMCDAAKRSLKKRGMPVPPWRRQQYMHAKWFSSSYTRTSIDSEGHTHITQHNHKGNHGGNFSFLAPMVQQDLNEAQEAPYNMRKAVPYGVHVPLIPEAELGRISNAKENRTDIYRDQWQLPLTQLATSQRNRQKLDPGAQSRLATLLMQAGVTIQPSGPQAHNLVQEANQLQLVAPHPAFVQKYFYPTSTTTALVA